MTYELSTHSNTRSNTQRAAPRTSRLLVTTMVGATLILSLTSGCSSMRPVANSGHDLIENPGRPLWARVPAGIGAIVGYVIATPVSAVLLPTLASDTKVVDSSQGYGEGAGRGDIQIPLVQAPYDYCGGVGAATLGWPFERLSALMHGTPDWPPHALDEKAEPMPGEPDPDLDFTTTPPVRQEMPRPEVSPPSPTSDES